MPEFEPKSRNEYLLNEIRKNTEGSGLPDVTTADNGKVLGVADGAWVPIVDTIIITATMTSQTGGTWDSEYTRPQLATAFAQGARIVVNVTGVASFDVGWTDANGILYMLCYMYGIGIVVAQIIGGGTDYESREFEINPVS